MSLSITFVKSTTTTTTILREQFPLQTCKHYKLIYFIFINIFRIFIMIT